MDQLFPFLQWLPWEIDLRVQRSRIMFAALCVPLGYGCSLGVGLYLGCILITKMKTTKASGFSKIRKLGKFPVEKFHKKNVRVK